MLLQRQNLKPREPKLHLGTKVPSNLWQLLNSLGPGVVDLDLETQGLDAADPALRITVLGLAGSENLLAFNTLSWTPPVWEVFFSWAKGRTFSAFNAVFDFSWLRRMPGGADFALHGCSLVLFKMLTTEGFFGQSWHLEDAVLDVLGWEDLNQKAWLRGALDAAKLSKGEMWKLGTQPETLEPFVRYCALDAEAARQLRLYLEGVAGEAVLRAWREEWNNYIDLAILAQHEGLVVDRGHLLANRDALEAELVELTQRLRGHPELAPTVQRIEVRKAEEFYKVSFRTKKVKLKKGEEPPEGKARLWHTIAGDRGYWCWEQVTRVVANEDREAPLVNFRSQQDLTELLWEGLAAGNFTVDKAAKTVTVGDRVVPLTESGALPVNTAAFACFGEVGKLLDLRSELATRLGFFDAYLEESERTGKIHPRFKAHGTVSGRQSGGAEG